MDELKLKSLILNHKERLFNTESLIYRNILDRITKELDSREIIFISGLRRSGKSSLMSLIASKLLGERNIKRENLLFLNFEDERFINFTHHDFDKVLQIYKEIEAPEGKTYLFFDEIQNIEGWERWVNRLYEFEDCKIFITGSNASLVSSDVSSVLTGRNRQVQLHPFSFKEFLASKNEAFEDRDLLLQKNKVKIKRAFYQYLNLGGFPEVIKNEDVTLAEQYFKDIIYRDVIASHKLRNIKELRELCLHLITNTGSISSYDSLKKTIDAKNTSTIKNYIAILEDVYLIRSLSKYDFSIKKQIYNPDKYYVSDIGFYNAVGFSFSENYGKKLENIVYQELIRRNKEIFYWKSIKGNEVDFLVRKGTKVIEAYQVTYYLNKENIERELSGLVHCRDEFGDIKMVLLTNEQEEIIDYQGINVKLFPIWKWLLTN